MESINGDEFYKSGPQPESPIDENECLTIPVDQLSPDSLRGIARELLLREIANDVPEYEIDESRVDQVIRGLRRGDFILTYNKRDESVGIQKKG